MSSRSCQDDASSKKLTIKQETFAQKVIEYLGDGYRAYVDVYGERKTELATRQAASRMQRVAHISARIGEMEKLRLSVSQITADYILNDIKEIGDEARVAERYAEALKSRELLGKNKRLFADVVENRADEAGVNESDRAVVDEMLSEQSRK